MNETPETGPLLEAVSSAWPARPRPPRGRGAVRGPPLQVLVSDDPFCGISRDHFCWISP
jgi:hypothetical protein